MASKGGQVGGEEKRKHSQSPREENKQRPIRKSAHRCLRVKSMGKREQAEEYNVPRKYLWHEKKEAYQKGARRNWKKGTSVLLGKVNRESKGGDGSFGQRKNNKGKRKSMIKAPQLNNGAIKYC